MSSREDAGKTKQLIVRTALLLVSEQGMSGLTAANLIQRAGISKGGLYHHFKQMDEVAKAALHLLIDEMLEQMTLEPAISVEHLLEHLERNVFRAFAGNPAQVKALYSFLAIAMFEQIYRQEMKRFFEQLRIYLRENLQAFLGRKLSQDKLDAVVQVLCTQVYGLAIHQYIHDEQENRNSWRAFRDSIHILLANPQVSLSR